MKVVYNGEALKDLDAIAPEIACSWDRQKVRFSPLRDVRRQKALGHHLHLASEDGLELDLDSRQIVKGSARRRIDQDIEVARLVVFASGRRPEDVRIGHTETSENLTDPVAVVLKGYGRPHHRPRAFGCPLVRRSGNMG